MNDNFHVKRLGNLLGFTGGSFAYMVYDADGLAPTLNCMGGGGREPMIVEEVKQEVHEQRRNMTIIEPRCDGVSNTITTVTKDNLLLEPQSCALRGRYSDEGGATNYTAA